MDGGDRGKQEEREPRPRANKAEGKRAGEKRKTRNKAYSTFYWRKRKRGLDRSIDPSISSCNVMLGWHGVAPKRAPRRFARACQLLPTRQKPGDVLVGAAVVPWHGMIGIPSPTALHRAVRMVGVGLPNTHIVFFFFLLTLVPGAARHGMVPASGTIS